TLPEFELREVFGKFDVAKRVELKTAGFGPHGRRALAQAIELRVEATLVATVENANGRQRLSSPRKTASGFWRATRSARGKPCARRSPSSHPAGAAYLRECRRKDRPRAPSDCGKRECGIASKPFARRRLPEKTP